MVSVATNEDEDDRPIWGWGFTGKDKGYQLLTIGAHSLRLHLYNHLLLTFRWLIRFYPRHLHKNSARKKPGPPPHTHIQTHIRHSTSHKAERLNEVLEMSCDKQTFEKMYLWESIVWLFASGLFVIVSWISFLIPMDVIPGRMALLVTLFLVLVNIFNTVTTNTPKVRSLPYFFTKCPQPRRRAWLLSKLGCLLVSSLSSEPSSSEYLLFLTSYKSSVIFFRKSCSS